MTATSTALDAAALELAAPARRWAGAAPDLGPWIEDRLRAWLESPQIAGGGETLSISVPAPEVEPEALLEVCAPQKTAFLWHPPGGTAVAGVGTARRIDLSGPGRFRELRDAAARLWTGHQTVHHPSCPPGAHGDPPRLYGGLAFDVGAAGEEPWEEFGDGCFTLPRLAYRRDAVSSLTLAVGREEARDRGAAELAAELGSVLAALGRWRTKPVASPMLLEIERPDRRRFAAEIEAIRRAIARSEVQKIVAAGRSRARLRSPLEPSAVLRRLRQGLVSSTRFAFCRQRATFLGATPERLISRRGRTIATEALAGSIASGADHRDLLGSGKDLCEHQLVVDAIVRRLEPLCARFEVASRPRIRELREVLHLHTPISGVLRAPRHVLELVEELHPTPAVGGVPAAAARDWIRRHERHPRGWYAAPVGWFDAAGDGEFDVALRSALLAGGEAFIYAGAGIVRDSDPDLEYTETELKKQALLAALGA